MYLKKGGERKESGGRRGGVVGFEVYVAGASNR